ncbi:sigma-70 family RNA polymerase sigma factor [Desulfitibacter alkalitolerans]|uniref:sigma-70 family RNA polymerase sigma factor n=1 Tax=Desulfitibacter alkalitolerans TaxID=264641 RepID=UPI000685BAB5|nr:sigma-70 family RNA polymerase sigma factor [Desulfitibacter alkalitolerans]
MERLADEFLVSKTLQGDKNAFCELIRRYEKQIYSLAYRLTNNLEDAQDLAQEAFSKIYLVLEKYDPGRPFFPWMYKVANNVIYSHLRSQRNKHQEISLDKVIDFSPLIPNRDTHPEEYSTSRETQRLVQQAIAELPEKYRVPLVLKYLEDLSYKSIGEILDLPVTTIETRLYRGKILLQKRLNKVMEGGEFYEVSRK